MLRLFAWFFKFRGWKIKGQIPSDIKKCVIIAAPHTSNWDFVFSLGALHILGYKVNYMVKQELFFFPFSILLKKSGGIAIDRKKNNNVVDEMVAKIKQAENMFLMLSAEGTRKRVDKWKSGFYYLEVLECGKKLDSKILSWLFVKYVNNNYNLHYELDGGDYYVGENEFLKYKGVK